ncbi:hypothetical protein Pelo_19782 [Pelomyxa schiedti]|nr:hypothetical protein Pelo_19782 [Pelomyxa schiedti]
MARNWKSCKSVGRLGVYLHVIQNNLYSQEQVVHIHMTANNKTCKAKRRLTSLELCDMKNEHCGCTFMCRGSGPMPSEVLVAVTLSSTTH